MEIGSSFQLSDNPKQKKYLLIKLPAKIVNKEKAIECLGGKKNIIAKNAKNENIELKLLYKKIPLEKCISNDILLKRKTKRSKKDPTKVKYEYEVMGKISNQYEFFTMHDFIYDSNVSDFSINDLKQFYISKDDYLKQLEDIKKETKVTIYIASIWVTSALIDIICMVNIQKQINNVLLTILSGIWANSSRRTQ